jgi:hypothetical protein
LAGDPKDKSGLDAGDKSSDSDSLESGFSILSEDIRESLT